MTRNYRHLNGQAISLRHVIDLLPVLSLGAKLHPSEKKSRGNIYINSNAIRIMKYSDNKPCIYSVSTMLNVIVRSFASKLDHLYDLAIKQRRLFAVRSSVQQRRCCKKLKISKYLAVMAYVVTPFAYTYIYIYPNIQRGVS